MDYKGMVKLQIMSDIVGVARSLASVAEAKVKELKVNEDADISEAVSMMEEVSDALRQLNRCP